MKLFIYLALFGIQGFLQPLYAQDTTAHRKLKVLPVPAFGYSPETRTYVGAVALFTMNFYPGTQTRTSNAKVEFNYTWRKQIISEAQWNYFFKDEQWFTQGIIHFSKYPDYYFGIGQNIPDSNRILFESNRLKIDVDGLKQLKKQWFTGLGVRYFNYSALGFTQDSINYEELIPSSNFGVRGIVLQDKRDNILTPAAGHYVKWYGELNTSQSNYGRIGIDLRKYFNWGKKMPQVLSTRFYSNHVIGNAPYYDLSLIGGDNYIRGYYYGRYRENNLSTLQTELRTTLFWRIGVSVFGGYSMIYHDFSKLNSSNLKPNAGVGLRFLVDKNEKTNLRFDYAIGEKGQNGFYVSFGESF